MKRSITGRKLKPTARSFFSSLLFDLSPCVVAAILTVFLIERMRIIVIIGDIISGLVALSALLTTISVHSRKVVVSESGLALCGLGGELSLAWSDVQKATLRERHNRFSGTDQLLVLTLNSGQMIPINPSVFSRSDRAFLIQEVRKRMPVAMHFDTPTV